MSHTVFLSWKELPAELKRLDGMFGGTGLGKDKKKKREESIKVIVASTALAKQMHSL